MLILNPIRARVAGVVLATAALVSLGGCTATVTAQPARPATIYDHPVVYVDDAPSRIYDSPSAYYRGRPAYLVGDRWYYATDGGWVYFRREPSELRRARTTRSFVRVEADAPRRSSVEQRPSRRRYVEEPRETRRRRYD